MRAFLSALSWLLDRVVIADFGSGGPFLEAVGRFWFAEGGKIFVRC